MDNRDEVIDEIATKLRAYVDKKGFLGVGHGLELLLGVSRPKLRIAVDILITEGYQTHIVVLENSKHSELGILSVVKVLVGPQTSLDDVKKKMLIRI